MPSVSPPDGPSDKVTLEPRDCHISTLFEGLLHSVSHTDGITNSF